jgi:trehalose 6-phosphate phosphatase
MTSRPTSPPALDCSDLALFLDIDGTLLEHQPHPEAVRVEDDLRDLLRLAKERLQGAVAFVTGRSISMVDRLFSPLYLPTAGIYGLEHRLRADGPVALAAEPADLAAVADQLEHQFRSAEGIYFERKGAVLAVHTRAAPALYPEVERAAEQALSTLAGNYRIVAGNAGLEFIPVEALKSAAIERFMAIEPFAGRRPVFLGDDTSDEVGFEFVNASGGVSIRVGPNRATAARYALPDVAAVHRWLRSTVAHRVKHSA